MKTSDRVDGKCPRCKDKTANDKKGRGFVRHLTDEKCKYGHGEKDEPQNN